MTYHVWFIQMADCDPEVNPDIREHDGIERVTRHCHHLFRLTRLGHALQNVNDGARDFRVVVRDIFSILLRRKGKMREQVNPYAAIRVHTAINPLCTEFSHSIGLLHDSTAFCMYVVG